MLYVSFMQLAQFFSYLTYKKMNWRQNTECFLHSLVVCNGLCEIFIIYSFITVLNKNDIYLMRVFFLWYKEAFEYHTCTCSIVFSSPEL